MALIGMPTDPLTSPSPLSAPMRGVLAGIARAARPPLYSLTPAQARAVYAAGAEVLEIERPPLERIDDLSVAARDGTLLAVRRYVPLAEVATGAEVVPVALPGRPVLLFLHGGGFTVGGIDTHDVLCRTLAAAAGCLVLSLDYRLAPEHRFPTAVNDAWDALQWIRVSAADWGGDPARIAVGGDSAGATLATVCATLARDAGWPLALQLLFYPGCASRPDSVSYRRFGTGYLVDRRLIDWFFDGYLRTDADRDDWRFAPLATPDIDGVAPAWFGLAECDPLIDEGLAYADRLRAAGVPVDLEIYRGVTHEFIKMGRAVPQARVAHRDAAAALRQAFERI